MKSRIPTVSLAAQENQQVIVEPAPWCCQKQSLYLASSSKLPQLPALSAAHTGRLEKGILCTALSSSCSIFHLAWVPKEIFSIFRIIFRLHSSLKKRWANPSLCWSGCSACPAQRPKKTLPSSGCARTDARATPTH